MDSPTVRRAPLTLHQAVGATFVFFSLFPWVSFGTNGLDSQPWPLMLAIVFLLVSIATPVRKDLAALLLLIPGVVLVGVWDSNELDFTFYRAVFGYSSVPLLALGYYVYLKKYGFPLPLVVAVNGVYLTVATLQQLFGVGIIGGLATLRTSAGRGMPSLATEPTYFGLLLILFSWLILIARAYRPGPADRLLVIVNLLFVVLVARSSTAVLFLMLGAMLIVFYRFRLRLYALLGFAAIALVVTYSVFLQQTRLASLVAVVQERGITGLIVSDASVNVRFAHVVIPWHGAVTSAFLPHGFSSFSAEFHAFQAAYGNFFWYAADSDRIMSYAGAFVFELGIIGLAFLASVFFLLYRPSRRRLYELVFLFVMLNSSLPVAIPLVPLLAVLLYTSSPPLKSQPMVSGPGVRGAQRRATRRISAS
jgi:hypothetical protein